MGIIKQKYTMSATPQEVWDALTNSNTIEKWSGDEAKMTDEKDKPFELWGGQMFGKNLQVVRNKKLVQQWCYDQWGKDKPSKVTFILTPKGKKTVVELTHIDVPEKSMKSISEGWDTYYLGAIQEMFDEIIEKKKKKK